MENIWIILGIVLAVIVVLLGILAFVGSKLQKKQNAAQEQMKQAAQQTTMLVIDKKRIKFKDANMPKIVMDQTPKYLKNSKVPIVKAKIGPQIINLMCDAKVYEVIPVGKTIKAVVSGIYITEVKPTKGVVLEKPKTKKQLKEEKKANKKAEKEAAKKDAKEVEKAVKKKK